MGKKVVTRIEQPNKNIAMPIDQYGRYGIVAQQIKDFKKQKKQQKIKILDIGGYKGEIHRFFTSKEADITIVDLYDSKDKNYVKGSALDLPFDDNTFDYVVSFEVFEHIPRKHRELFISEALRVGSGSLILTAPFSGDHDEVLRSEVSVNEFWRTMYGDDHPWLKEHIDYRTPKRTELESILKAKRLPFVSVGNNDLILWNFMVSFNYLTTQFRGSGLNPEVQEFYNKNTHYFESNAQSYYRYIYTIGADAKLLKEANYNRTKDIISDVDKQEKSIELIQRVFVAIAADVKRLKSEQRKEVRLLSRKLEERIKLYDSLVEELQAIKATSLRYRLRQLKQFKKR